MLWCSCVACWVARSDGIDRQIDSHTAERFMCIRVSMTRVRDFCANKAQEPWSKKPPPNLSYSLPFSSFSLYHPLSLSFSHHLYLYTSAMWQLSQHTASEECSLCCYMFLAFEECSLCCYMFHAFEECSLCCYMSSLDNNYFCRYIFFCFSALHGTAHHGK